MVPSNASTGSIRAKFTAFQSLRYLKSVNLLNGTLKLMETGALHDQKIGAGR